MIRMTSHVGVTILGATAVLAALVMAVVPASGSQASAVATGPHATEPFCRTIVEQAEMFAKFVATDLADAAKRAKYFEAQRDVNATLVKQAPAAIAADVALQTKNANAAIDAQLSRDPAKMKASTAALRSPENLAASKRMTEYCGVKAAAAK